MKSFNIDVRDLAELLHQQAYEIGFKEPNLIMGPRLLCMSLVPTLS